MRWEEGTRREEEGADGCRPQLGAVASVHPRFCAAVGEAVALHRSQPQSQPQRQQGGSWLPHPPLHALGPARTRGLAGTGLAGCPANQHSWGLES